MKLFFSIVSLSLVSSSLEAATIYNSLPYRSQADSPFKESIQLGHTLLEDFEDGAANTPGMAIRTVRGGISNPLRWSVDGDDGVLDNIGHGYSWVSPGGSLLDHLGYTIEVSFSPDANGNYPTHAGLVLLGFSPVDLGYTRKFQAWDAQGQLIPESVITAALPVLPGGGDTFLTYGDRFFGLIHEAGISKIYANDVHFDHIQFGYGAIPEPGSTALALLGGLRLAERRRRKQGIP